MPTENPSLFSNSPARRSAVAIKRPGADPRESPAGGEAEPALCGFLFRHPSRRVQRRPLREFFADAARHILPGTSVSCLIADDGELRELNRKFLRKDYPTDVLSFPASNGGLGGEMAISLDRAAAQAAEFGHSVEEELRILMIHGLLHLAGMDHESDAGQMARSEAHWRKRFKLPPGLIARTGPTRPSKLSETHEGPAEAALLQRRSVVRASSSKERTRA